jgi:hypothetical protein
MARTALLLVAILQMLFLILPAQACDRNEDCSRCVASAFGHCVAHGNDPSCEARKAACKADTTQSGPLFPLGQDAFFETFLKYDYAETKDLAKDFLTLVSAILMFSLTFAEKIVNFQTASRLLKTIMVAAWGLFIVAISLTGLALCLIALAGGSAAYHQLPGFLDEATTAWELMVVAGITFVLGLLSLVIAASFSAFMPTVFAQTGQPLP